MASTSLVISLFPIRPLGALVLAGPTRGAIRQKPSMLVGGVRRVLHDANVHRLSNRYSNRLSCVVIDEARGTFEEDIIQCLVHIELAERIEHVVAATLYLDGELVAPAP